VKRARKITLKALDQDFNPVTIKAEGLLACVFQHEIDHLRGRMIVDYASLFDKVRLKKKLAELYRRSENDKLPEPGEEQRKLRL
jgi:peptide deformylase